MDIYAAIGHALAKWEPRIQLQAVSVEAAEPGELVVSLTALINGQLQRLDSIALTLRPAPMLLPARMQVP
jgi:phage baseplate assembly protein W